MYESIVRISLGAQNAVGFNNGYKHMVKYACWYGALYRIAVSVELIGPASRERTTQMISVKHC
jgi:hypothetical protein